MRQIKQRLKQLAVVEIFIFATQIFVQQGYAATQQAVNLIEELRINKNRIDVIINRDFKDQYLRDDFFVEYEDEINLEQLDYSIVTIPFIMNVVSMVWISGKRYCIESMDENLYYSLKKIHEIFELLYPNTSWNGELIPKKLVKNSVSLQEDGNRIALLFTCGLDSVCSSLRHRDKKQLLINIFRIEEVFGKEYELDYKQQLIDFAQQYGHENSFMRSNFLDFLNHRVLNTISPEIDCWRTGAVEGLSWAGLVAPILVWK